MKFTNSITIQAESSYHSNNSNNNNEKNSKKKSIRRSTPIGHLPYEENFKDFLDAEKIEFYETQLNEPSFYHDDNSTEEENNNNNNNNNKYIAPKLSTTEINFLKSIY